MKRPDVVKALLMSSIVFEALAEQMVELHGWLERRIDEAEDSEIETPFEAVPHLKPMMETLNAALEPVRATMQDFWLLPDKLLQGTRLSRREYFLCRYLGLLRVESGRDEYVCYRRGGPETWTAITEALREDVRRMHTFQ